MCDLSNSGVMQYMDHKGTLKYNETVSPLCSISPLSRCVGRRKLPSNLVLLSHLSQHQLLQSLNHPARAPKEHMSLRCCE